MPSDRAIDNHRGSWEGLNVPDADGQALHDIVLQHNYKNALEIGTSTGHSAIWIAWALSKTGGKLITIEIDRDAYEEALVNFRETGLAKYIDARLADAHQLVPELPGPFDFVFCDADKDWYSNYLESVLPKLTVGGCFAAHNVSGGYYSGDRGRSRGGFGRGYGRGGDFWESVNSIPIAGNQDIGHTGFCRNVGELQKSCEVNPILMNPTNTSVIPELRLGTHRA